MAPLQYLSLLLPLLPLTNAACKATPGTHTWPSPSAWSTLNTTLSGHLLAPLPPAAPCHPTEPSYDATLCKNITASWTDYSFHASNPVSSAWDNFNNDTCVPDAEYSCSGKGYPVYVVDARSAEDVAAGVKFAKENGVRVVVKGTGHDYLGRSSGASSLSIWTHNLRGMTAHGNFAPTGCGKTMGNTAVTVAAGHNLIDVYAFTDTLHQTVVGGESETVGVGGYISGGGHSALSTTYGLAADNVLEISMVTPSGDIVIANECQNRDLFFAQRGGGGGTFGVMLNITMKTFPTMPYSIMPLIIYTGPSTETFWDILTYIVGQFSYLEKQSISGYCYTLPVVPISANQSIGVIESEWHDHNSAFNASNLTAVFEPIISHIKTTWGAGIVQLQNYTEAYETRYAAAVGSHDTTKSGGNQILGSRLMTEEVLGSNATELKGAIKGFTGTDEEGGAAFLLVSGRGVWDAEPAGGSDAVCPAWRKALGHFTTQISWDEQNPTQQAAAYATMNERVGYLEAIQPDTGSYVNEANINQPNYQQTFWGDNYAKLAAIKKEHDPTDVFWCHPCVGDEGWEEVGDQLCTT